MATELSLRDTLRADWRANRNPRIRLLITLFRLAHASRGTSRRAPLSSIPVVALYKLVSEWGLGIEIPSSTRIGPGLKIEHGYGLVINSKTVLGANVLLKHGVTLGIRGAGANDGAPTLGDGVVLGPGAQILGRVVIGDRVRVGAGAIVLQDVPSDHTAVGNPARVLPPKGAVAGAGSLS